ncbi:MAG: hypothetical protein PVI66_04370 [Candidatus Aminicenantes bacterium]|jgi:hypothetical protein
MSKQKVGLILFWIAIFWAFLWGVFLSFSVDSAFNNLTMDELNQTMWATDGTWYWMWAFGVPLAAIVAAVGIVLYVGAKGLKALKYGIGILLAVFIGMMAGFLGHIRPLFGIGGALILLSFTGIMWMWAKERMAIKDGPTIATDLKMVGYVFMLIAAWFICGIASQPYLKALDETSPSTPIHVMIFLVLGWLFLFLSHLKSRKQQA